MESAQESDLSPFFEIAIGTKKHLEIKPPLNEFFFQELFGALSTVFNICDQVGARCQLQEGQAHHIFFTNPEFTNFFHKIFFFFFFYKVPIQMCQSQYGQSQSEKK